MSRHSGARRAARARPDELRGLCFEKEVVGREVGDVIKVALGVRRVEIERGWKLVIAHGKQRCR